MAQLLTFTDACCISWSDVWLLHCRAGGCFWGLELAYQREPGVAKTSVGYTQGDVEGPSYQAVCSGRTGHTEAVQVHPPCTSCQPSLHNLCVLATRAQRIG